jgi:hypothetical protein
MKILSFIGNCASDATYIFLWNKSGVVTTTESGLSTGDQAYQINAIGKTFQ